MRRLQPYSGDLLKKAIRAWSRPVRSQLESIDASMDKPIGQMTMPELMAWVYVLGYGGLTGYVAGTMAANLLHSALRGPRR